MKLDRKLISICCVFTISVNSQNFIDKYLTDPLVYTTIGTAANGLDQPRDLDFKPHTNELWVINNANSNGGTNVIFYNAGQPNQSSQFRKDSHSGHFMIFPSAMAFSDIGEWACTSEIKNTANANSTFMGPALWLSDTNIFAKVFQNNWQSGFPLGSHTDMLHQSPFAMGIAHENDNIYWVFDGYHGNICKYEFVTDHGPGYDNHSDGKIWRYTDITVSRVVDVPSHMVMDKASKWLYIIDGGSKKVMRINTTTGNVTANLTAHNEILASYKAVTGTVKETVDTYTSQPCGIDHYNNRLLVGDYLTGEIRIYNTAAATPSLMGTIVTGQPGIMGIKVGNDGRIWFVNKSQNKVVRIDPLPALNDVSVHEIIAPGLENFEPFFYSTGFNVCSGNIFPVVVIKNTGTNTITSLQIDYTIDGSMPVATQWAGSLIPDALATVTLNGSFVTSDEHKLKIYTSSPNGAADDNRLNDVKEGSFRSLDPVKNIPFGEDFNVNVFPPPGWSYLGYNKFCKMSRSGVVGAYGTNDGSLQMDNSTGIEDISGQEDYFMSPRIILSNTGKGTKLSFDVAYAQYSTSSNDRLKVDISENCGKTWNSVYNKSGSALSTALPTTAIFVPEFDQWRTEEIDLDTYKDKEVLILFTSVSNFGNNFYIDNITFNYVLAGVEDWENNFEINIFPNPASDKINARIQNARITGIELLDVLGKRLPVKRSVINESEWELDLQNAGPGSYLIKVITNRGVIVRKFIAGNR